MKVHSFFSQPPCTLFAIITPALSNHHHHHHHPDQSRISLIAASKQSASWAIDPEMSHTPEITTHLVARQQKMLKWGVGVIETRPDRVAATHSPAL
jgi:hypothetical protein